MQAADQETLMDCLQDISGGGTSSSGGSSSSNNVWSQVNG